MIGPAYVMPWYDGDERGCAFWACWLQPSQCIRFDCCVASIAVASGLNARIYARRVGTPHLNVRIGDGLA